ncbi:MAG: asparagine--tRNA ligase [Flavobacteriales bacterium]|nr:asparagine--tRNA ligase [Flavobacteriales bacterium]MBP9079848.1 asparagine--tRNA ligase [Flavobacteriales bacterium]
MFQVTTLPIEKAPFVQNSEVVDFSIFSKIRGAYAERMSLIIHTILKEDGNLAGDADEIVKFIEGHLCLAPDVLGKLASALKNNQLEGVGDDEELAKYQEEVIKEAFRIFQVANINELDFNGVEAEVSSLCKHHGYTLRRRIGGDNEKTHQFPTMPELGISFHNLFEILHGKVDYKTDFFGRKTHLTVSGQLQAELAATALGKVYTFGPTFRAENSNTTRHLAEFWMIEPEAAFMDLHGDMDLAEGLCKHLIARVLKNSVDDLQFLDARLKEEEAQKPQAQRSDMGLIDRLKFVLENPFERITYTEAIDILLRSKPHQKKQFQFPVEWGIDLQSEHERYLVEKHFKKPVIVTGYPAQIKAFYMRTNGPGDFGYSDKGTTVAAMDVLFPGIGEIIGGSQREERLDVLQARMQDMGVPQEELWWYLDTRRYGTVPHAGFGLGLERFVLFVTGMGNIRDVIPFPRTPGSAEF